jgi:putative polyhydroxyalkanoate system protein
MATIRIQHAHNQPDDVVRTSLHKLTDELQRELQLTCVWGENHIDFHRSGASGKLQIQPHRVDIDIKLNMMLSVFEKKIRNTITDYCKEHLP